MKKYFLFAVLAFALTFAFAGLAHEGEADPTHHDDAPVESSGGTSTGAKVAAGAVLIVAVGVIAKKFLFTKSVLDITGSSAGTPPETPKNTP